MGWWELTLMEHLWPWTPGLAVPSSGGTPHSHLRGAVPVGPRAHSPAAPLWH